MKKQPKVASHGRRKHGLSTDILRAFQENKLVHANDSLFLSCPLNGDSLIPVCTKKLLCKQWACTCLCIIFFSLFTKLFCKWFISNFLWGGCTEVDLIMLLRVPSLKSWPRKLQLGVEKQNKTKTQKAKVWKLASFGSCPQRSMNL